MDATVIFFDDWEQVLKTAVPPDRQRAYREAIIKFRYWLRETGKTASAKVFKEHLDKPSAQGCHFIFVRTIV